ncbi:MAG: methionine sulfoxide reductase heme-binding subunit [Gaiellaceae bacterium]|nr:methionine sulfoxide reductase heme-binding subunit [Gaiellaceae bacterium]
MHLTSSPVDWYAARAAGIVAYVLLSAVVSFGLALSGKRLPRWPRFAVEDVHRFGGLLTGTFIAVHVATIAIDSYLPFSIGSLVVPFVSRYRPLPTALGIVAAELLLALAVTNRLRNRRVSYAFWRRAHYLNFAVWGAATVHGIGSGTDAHSAWLLALYAVAVGVVALLLARRLPGLGHLKRAPALCAIVGIALVLGLAFGPFQSHTRPWNGASFSERLTGSVLRNVGPTRGLVSLAGTGVGPQRVVVRADLLIDPKGLVSTAFQMEYVSSGATCRGTVTQVGGYGFSARCRMPDRTSRLIRAHWNAAPGTALHGGVIESRG